MMVAGVRARAITDPGGNAYLVRSFSMAMPFSREKSSK
jgi:hypothetical protein